MSTANDLSRQLYQIPFNRQYFLVDVILIEHHSRYLPFRPILRYFVKNMFIVNVMTSGDQYMHSKILKAQI